MATGPAWDDLFMALLKRQFEDITRSCLCFSQCGGARGRECKTCISAIVTRAPFCRNLQSPELRAYALSWLRKVALEMHAELDEEISKVM
jgi:hypothetical protein